LSKLGPSQFFAAKVLGQWAQRKKGWDEEAFEKRFELLLGNKDVNPDPKRPGIFTCELPSANDEMRTLNVLPWTAAGLNRKALAS
jgi:hypothetical protein